MPDEYPFLPDKGPGSRKFGKVMREFERGELHTPDGMIVRNEEQAKAIAAAEARRMASDGGSKR